MPAHSPVQVKSAILGAGLEVYRTKGEWVQLAERPRENLIMDARVAIATSDPTRVSFVVRAQKSDFPADGDDDLFAAARSLAAGAELRGYAEVATFVAPMTDPGDPGRTLDTWFEVRFEKAVADLDEAVAEARFALGLEKVAARRPGGAL